MNQIEKHRKGVETYLVRSMQQTDITKSVLRMIMQAKQMSGVKNITDEDLCILVELIVKELKNNVRYSRLSVGEISFAIKEGCCYRYGEYTALSFGRIIHWIDRYMSSEERKKYLEIKNSIVEEGEKRREPTEEEIRTLKINGLNKDYELFFKSDYVYLPKQIEIHYLNIIRDELGEEFDSILEAFNHYKTLNKTKLI